MLDRMSRTTASVPSFRIARADLGSRRTPNRPRTILSQLIVCEARSPIRKVDGWPHSLSISGAFFSVLLPRRPGIVGRPFISSLASVQYQARGSIWICSGEEDAHIAALRGAEQHGAFRAHGIHDRVHICHACSSVGYPTSRSEIPVPRLSKRMKRVNRLKRSISRARGGYSQSYSMLLIHPDTNTRSIGPSPVT